MKRIDEKYIINKKFNRLTVIKAMGNNEHNLRLFLCRCDCDGNEKLITLSDLRSGKTKSCGCFNKELQSKRCFKHGYYSHPLYYTWKGMMARCYNDKNINYKYYGSRGITVCSEWHDLKNFIKDIEPIRIPGLTLHRKNNDGNYEPGNIEYATKKVQNNLKRNNVLIDFNNKTQNLTQWAEELKMNSDTLWARLFRYHWTTEDALSIPVQ